METVFRPGEMIVELRPEMVGGANPLGLATSILELLAMLRREHGAIRIRTLWPVGVSVLQGVGGPLAGLLLPKLLKKLPSHVQSTVKELLAAPAVAEAVDPILAQEARLRLRITLPPGEDVAGALQKVLSFAGVESAEAVPYMFGPALRAKSREDRDRAFSAADISGFGGPSAGGAFPMRPEGDWGVRNTQRPKDWDELGLRNIAVLDSGCDEKHPGLSGSVDYANKESRRDGYGHGTFVTHMIAGRAVVANEDIGVDEATVSDTPPGMLPGSRVWVANVMDPEPYDEGDGRLQYSLDPGRFSYELNRLAKRATKRMREIDVVNLSLGSATGSRVLKKDMKALEKAGILVVAAAGNAPEGEQPGELIYPAAYPQTISVGAMRFGKNQVWPRTNSGIPKKEERGISWEICAPGEWILSGLPMDDNSMELPFSGWLSGTSMAAPFVTAAVAVLCAQGIKDREEVVSLLQGLAHGGEWLICPAAKNAAGL